MTDEPSRDEIIATYAATERLAMEHIQGLEVENKNLRTQVASLRAALEWYADEKNYDAYAQAGVGERARAALAGGGTK